MFGIFLVLILSMFCKIYPIQWYDNVLFIHSTKMVFPVNAYEVGSELRALCECGISNWLTRIYVRSEYSFLSRHHRFSICFLLFSLLFSGLSIFLATIIFIDIFIFKFMYIYVYVYVYVVDNVTPAAESCLPMDTAAGLWAVNE